jgi:hypothetical protein
MIVHLSEPQDSNNHSSPDRWTLPLHKTRRRPVQTSGRLESFVAVTVYAKGDKRHHSFSRTLHCMSTRSIDRRAERRLPARPASEKMTRLSRAACVAPCMSATTTNHTRRLRPRQVVRRTWMPHEGPLGLALWPAEPIIPGLSNAPNRQIRSRIVACRRRPSRVYSRPSLLSWEVELPCNCAWDTDRRTRHGGGCSEGCGRSTMSPVRRGGGRQGESLDRGGSQRGNISLGDIH